MKVEDMKRAVKHCLPNSSGDLFALVHRSSAAARGNPNYPCKLVQIVGGRTWSISYIKLGEAEKGREL